ncbi:MAG TPA: hypothetical protein VHS55_00240 [Solirubrobacteraceae bacterium]|jgi:hypothetical protein|nr:hypothetical protein [Solirubrobacteraceae bacterium]
MSRSQTPNIPRSIRAHAPSGTPVTVDGQAVETVRESWLVQDRWWTEQPVQRRYWEILTIAGRNVVVFHDLVSGRWYTQAA